MIELLPTEQEIHAIVKDMSLGISWLLSTIYASPRYAEMKLLWENISTVAGLTTCPKLWLVTSMKC